ncbi:MAG: PLP-dependent aminotransferase family protein, partial [Bacillota bacterium]|nr:PLP-dependent aminotransferase family protein [Bacillota bacterium]
DYVSFESDFDDLYSKAYEENLISFGGGVAAREPYPPDEIAAIFEKIITGSRERAYFYTPYQGDRTLRKEIAEFLETKGIITGASNIQMFSENNQALDFLMTLMLPPGDKVVTQEILSPDVYRTIRMAGGQIVTVPMDENGMLCDHLEALLQKEKPKFIYVDSSFQNPTGALLTIERRKKLLELSYKYRIPIIEEDEGSELYYGEKAVPSIKSMDTGSNVIYMYSFSLTMVPGLGISFVIADKDVVTRLSRMISMRIVTLDWAPQMLMLEYMREGIFFQRLETFRTVCRQKRDLMYEQLLVLAKEFSIEFSKPEGGVYFWVRLPKGMDARQLLKEAQKEGVAFIPGYIFYPKSAGGRDHIRLNYSYPTAEQIEEGMPKLGNAMSRLQQKIQIK